VAKNTRSLKHGVAVSALFSAISLFYGASANASFYPGHIDPGGTGTVPGFIGNFVVSIDPGCLADGLNFTGVSGCGNASVYSANIDLYSPDPGDPPFPGNILGTFSLGTSDPHLLPPSTFDIFEVLAFGGQPVEISTTQMGSVPGTGVYSSNQFWLEFFFFTDGGIGFVDPAVIFMDFLDFEHRSNEGIVTFGPACQEVGGVPVNCVIGATPEPGVLSLVLGALGGGWLARRRRDKERREAA
jgi:hypothetical protein